jgi:hypothetical protein
MLSLDDSRWNEMAGPLGPSIDVRDRLQQLEKASDPTMIWPDLWQSIVHQGTIGEASFAAVPHLVRIERLSSTRHWQTYALGATVDLARGRGANPECPEWLEDSYLDALDELRLLGIAALRDSQDLTMVRAILGLIATVSGMRVHGRFIIDYSEDELLELEERQDATE